MDISEKEFEATIERVLLSTPMVETAGTTRDSPFAPGGYRRRKPEDYERSLCLDPEVVLDFIYATQPKEWKTQAAAWIGC